MSMEIIVSNQTRHLLYKHKKIYKHLFEIGLKTLNKGDNYCLSVTFVNKEMIKEINSAYRGIDKPTDVISFAFLDDKNEIIINEAMPINLGEIYICYDVANANRKVYGNSLKRELSFLFVHGLLHLFGYDHIKKEDEEIMFPLQEEILKGEKK